MWLASSDQRVRGPHRAGLGTPSRTWLQPLGLQSTRPRHPCMHMRIHMHRSEGKIDFTVLAEPGAGRELATLER